MMSFGWFFFALVADLVHVDAAVGADVVVHGLVELPRAVDRGAVREMAAVRQVEAEERVARLERSRGRWPGWPARPSAAARSRRCRSLDHEERLRAIAGEVLDLIDELAAAVVAFARKALGVLVRERAPERLEHGLAHVVLGRDELEIVVLPLDLLADGGVDLGIVLDEPWGHGGSFRASV